VEKAKPKPSLDGALPLHGDKSGRTLEGLKRKPADDVVRSVATEETVEIQGKSRSEAEAVILYDPVFPAEPFAR
jgi:hypothetical protein